MYCLVVKLPYILIHLFRDFDYFSEKGKKIFDEIFSIQKKRIYNALLNSSAKEVVNFNNVLKK